MSSAQRAVEKIAAPAQNITRAKHAVLFSSLEGALSFAPFGEGRTYITAGLAYGRTNHSFIDAAGANHDISTTKIGWVAGIGAEYGLDPRWSVKTEVLYVDLGKDQTTVSGVAFGNFPSRFETADTMWILRAGVNYKFGG